MIEYSTSFVPPKRSERTPLEGVTIAEVIRSVIDDDLEAERFIRFTKQRYHEVFVAFRGTDILGFQLCDYDHHEMNIVLGRQVLSSLLSEEDVVYIGRRLGDQAKDRYEDMF